MLPKTLGVLLLLISLIVTGKLIYDETIAHFWTTPWIVGNISVITLVAVGISLMNLAEEDGGSVALIIFGFLYTIATLILYSAWAVAHIRNSQNTGDYFGCLVLVVVTAIIASIGLGKYSKIKSSKVFLFPAWDTGLLNVGAIFYLVYKYVFNEAELIY